MARNEISGYCIALVEERPDRAKGKKAVEWKVVDSIRFGPKWDLDELKSHLRGLSESIDRMEWPYEYMLAEAIKFDVGGNDKIPETIRVPSMTREFIEKYRKEREQERVENERRMRDFTRRAAKRRKR